MILIDVSFGGAGSIVINAPIGTTTKAKLGVGDHSDPEAVQASYIERVREAHGNPDFEGILLELNLAREVLLAGSAGDRAIVPVLGSELVAIAARQNELIKINEARDEIKDTLGSIERRSVRQIKSGRDIAGLFSAASGGLLFAKDNIKELIPSLVASTRSVKHFCFAPLCLGCLLLWPTINPAR